MSKFSWRNGFASGLVFSVLFVAAFVVVSSVGHEGVSEVTNNIDQSANKTNHCGDGNEPVWGPWFGLCFGLFDTIAQWMMMAFTVVAAGLLYGTLRQASKTNSAAIKAAEAANRTNQIMRDEQRPWLKIHEPALTSIRAMPFGFGGRDKSIWIELSVGIENIGKTPAHQFNFCWNCMIGNENIIKSDEMAKAAIEAIEGGNTILPTEIKIVRISSVVDVDVPPKGTRHTLDLWMSVGAAYKIESGGESKIAWRTFMLSQTQVGNRGGATLCGLDLIDVEEGTAEIEFVPFLSEAN